MIETRYKNSRAFVLAELLVVIAIIGLVLAVTIPSLGRAHRAAAFRAATRIVAAKLSYAHRQSIIKGKSARLAIDAREKQTWIEYETDPGIFSAENTSVGSKQRLPSGVAEINVLNTAAPDKSEGTKYITFHPDGTADPATIIIRSEGETAPHEITVHPATGAVTAKE